MPPLISSLQHPLIKHLVKLRQNSHYRTSQTSLVIEGVKPITEICQQTKAKLILTCNKQFLSIPILTEKFLLCTESVMEKASGLINSEGILAEIPLPIHPSIEDKKSLLVLDCINDPGNMGTLMRTALALGWEGAFLVGDCCDPYNEKALRASRGASLNLPWMRKNWEELKSIAKRFDKLPLLADLDGQPPEPLSPDQGVMLILSNEARGPSKEALEWCKKISIPLSSEVESLNVAIAGAILMYVIRSSTGVPAP